MTDGPDAESSGEDDLQELEEDLNQSHQYVKDHDWVLGASSVLGNIVRPWMCISAKSSRSKGSVP